MHTEGHVHAYQEAGHASDEGDCAPPERDRASLAASAPRLTARTRTDWDGSHADGLHATEPRSLRAPQLMAIGPRGGGGGSAGGEPPGALGLGLALGLLEGLEGLLARRVARLDSRLSGAHAGESAGWWGGGVTPQAGAIWVRGSPGLEV